MLDCKVGVRFNTDTSTITMTWAKISIISIKGQVTGSVNTFIVYTHNLENDIFQWCISKNKNIISPIQVQELLEKYADSLRPLRGYDSHWKLGFISIHN